MLDRLPLRIELVESQPFAENSYVVWKDGSTECLVVDPGLEPELILEVIEREGLTVAAILNTHGHADHIAGNAAIKQAWPAAPLVIGAGDAPMLTNPTLNLSQFYGVPLTSPPADLLIHHGQSHSWAGITLEVREIPGHSIGHVVFLYRDGEPQLVIGGDVLFAGSVGRTDFPDGDPAALERGIREHLYTLPDATIVLPGHGNPTTVGQEKRTNPFVRG